MRRISIIVWLALTSAFLAACGGSSCQITGEGNGGCGGPGGAVSTVTVNTSATTIASDGSTTATITAVAKNSANAIVEGAMVTFTTSAGDITVTQATTDATGTATATLAAGSATSGTAITVTATSGSAKGTTTVTVGSTQETITLVTSVPSIASDGATSATITALVRNAQNQLVNGIPVTFSASSGGLAVDVSTTGGTNTVTNTVAATGSAVATLSAAGDPTNRTITVTATAAGATATVPVAVTGTALTVTGPSNLVSGSSGTFTVALTEGGGTGIANQAVTLTSAKGNTLSTAAVTTQANGQQTFTVTAVNGGTDTITATALKMTATTSVAVSTQNFAFTAPAAANSPVNVGSTGTLTVSWTSAGSPQTGSAVTFSTTRGTLSSSTATIGSNGLATVTITSTTAGPAVVTATGSGVTATASIEFIATDPTAIAVQASPTTIATQGQSTITATVRDPNNNLVEGQVVDFTITQDATGGSLSVPSATTNVQGQATTVYTASTTTSAANGVVISATVASATSVTSSASLTVGGQSVFLSLGTGNLLSAYSETQYEYPYSVQAVDAAGNGVNGVTITFSVESMGYFKGYMVYGTQWAPYYTTAQYSGETNPTFPDADIYPPVSGTTYVPLDGAYGCLSEDVAANGILIAAEDYNGNGKLDPGLVVSTDVSSAVTVLGSAAVNLIYPKDHAYWVAVKLTATATVSGNQSSASTTFILQGLASDYSSSTIAPPGKVSPYGQALVCRNPN
jgi:hypothetical protein